MKIKTAHAWTEKTIFKALAPILSQVAPLKVKYPVFPETSLSQDLDFDSLDAMDLLLAVNEHFSIGVDFEAWMAEESERKDKPFTIGSLCRSIMKALEEV